MHYHGYEGQSNTSMQTDARHMLRMLQRELRRQSMNFAPSNLGHSSGPFG
jgi:hypothetical protein